MPHGAAKRGMRLDSSLARADGVTLVAVRATNTADRPRRVRVANRLDGPVWPPRTGGRPAPGWDDGGYEGVFAAGETRSLGYATPATPADSDAADDPVTVAWAEDAPDGPPDTPPTPGVLVSRLGDPRPPRDALPGSTGRVEIPPPVAAWLDDVASRVEDDSATPADRETLDRVVARANDLRRVGWP